MEKTKQELAEQFIQAMVDQYPTLADQKAKIETIALEILSVDDMDYLVHEPATLRNMTTFVEKMLVYKKAGGPDRVKKVVREWLRLTDQLPDNEQMPIFMGIAGNEVHGRIVAHVVVKAIKEAIAGPYKNKEN